MESLTLNISGMSCAHCVGRVTSALENVVGVEVESVKVGSASVAYDPATTSPARIAAAVRNAGYDVEPSGSAAR